MHAIPGRPRRALFEAALAWLLLVSLPGLLCAVFPPLTAHALAFALIALLLTSPRMRCGRWRAAGRRVLVAGVAGLATSPLWLAGVAGLGGWLGWARPPAAAPPTPLHFLLACGLGPWLEELLYRGRLLDALRGLGGPAAVGVTSLLFALPHPDRWSRLSSFSLGIALGCARWKRVSLASCFGYHAGLNLAALAAASLLAPSAASAEAWAFEGTLRLEPVVSAYPPIEIEGSGVATAVASGAALTTLVLAGGISGSAAVPVTDPLAAPVMSWQLDAGVGSGTLGPFQPPATPISPQLTRSTLPVLGELRFCLLLLPACLASLGVDLHRTTPLGTHGVGVGGLITLNPGSLRISLHAAPWTVRTATLTVETPGGATLPVWASGGAHGPLSFTGSTLLPGGGVELVTPLRIESSGGLAVSAPMFARLSIRFLPEPGAFVLLAAGSLALAGLGRRRRRGGT